MLLAIRAAGSRFLLLVGVLFVVYLVADLLPGDPVRLAMGPTVSGEAIAERRAALGLDRSVVERFVSWLSGLVQGDLGTTVRGESVNELIGDRLGATLMLAGGAFALVAATSVGWALVWCVRAEGRFAAGSSVLAPILVAMPEFVLGTLLILVFASVLDVLPATTVMTAAGDLADPDMLVLPILALGIPHAAWNARVAHAALREAARLPHVEQARMDGMGERSTVLRHVLPLSAPTIVASLATGVGTLLGGTVVVESLFNYPGAGGLIAGSLASRDASLLLSMAALTGVVVVAGLLIADAIRAWALRGRT